MDQTEALVKTIVEGLQEKKAKHCNRRLNPIIRLDLQYMIICEGSTPTQVSALSDSAWDFAHRKAGEKPLSIDGAQRAEWIGMDYGTVLVHIFLPELREFYNLENLWSDAKVTQIVDLD